MEKRYGGQMTRGGIYVSLRTGEFVTVPREGGELPGEAKVRYVKVPTALATVLGPVIGLTYVIFLPLIGIITLGWLVGRLVGKAVAAIQVKTGQLAGAEWQPGVSYFARKGRKGHGKGEEIEELGREIEERKRQQ